MNKIHFNKKGYKMSRSVFANTIGAFVLDGIPSHVRSNEGYVDTFIEKGKEKAKEYAADAAQDALDSVLESSGITSGQSSDVIVVPQQSTPQDYNPMAAMSAIARERAPIASAGFVPLNYQAFRQAEATSAARGAEQAQRDAQRAVQYYLDANDSEVTGSEVTESPEKPKKPFFKTGAGIATILVGAAAVAGGIVYFATQE